MTTDPSHGNPYVTVLPASASGRSEFLFFNPLGPMDSVCEALNRCGKRVDDAARKASSIADNVWHHLRVSPKISDAAMARLVQGTRLLTEGGHDKLFQRTFPILPGEKLIDAYVCYLSTSTGPVMGTVYISNKRIAFCSDHPVCYYPSPGHQEWMHYKVVVQLDQLMAVNPSANGLNPSEKYISILTRDGYEFWFMGFISYDKALKAFADALQHVGHIDT